MIRSRDLNVLLSASEHDHRMPHALDDRRGIGTDEPILRCSPMRIQHQPGAERLRCLCDPQVIATLEKCAVGSALDDSLGGWNRENGRATSPGLLGDGPELHLADEGPDRVVDQDAVDVTAFYLILDGEQAAVLGLVPSRSTGDDPRHLADVSLLDERAASHAICLSDHQHDGVNDRRTFEQVEGPSEDHPATDQEKHLVRWRDHPSAASCSEDDRGDSPVPHCHKPATLCLPDDNTGPEAGRAVRSRSARGREPEQLRPQAPTAARESPGLATNRRSMASSANRASAGETTGTLYSSPVMR